MWTLRTVASVVCALAAWFVEMVPPDARDTRFFVWTRDGHDYEPAWA